jgi:hypothetical protein
MESTEATTAAAPIAAKTAATEDDGDSTIDDLLPQNLDALDNEDSSDEGNEQPPQIKMAILPHSTLE